METVCLNFYGVGVVISCPKEIADLINKDFEYFQKPASDKNDFFLDIYRKPPTYSAIQGLKARRQSDKCITYKINGIIYNDYHGKALSIYDKKSGKLELHSEEHDLLHELTYLATLSLSGKKLDLKGMHKIHAFGLTYKSTALIGMMPSKGGKSTLLLDLLSKNPHYKILSDDTPMVDRSGSVYPFPSRVGVDDLNEHSDVFDRSQVYTLKRRFYGLKTLIPISSIQNSVFHDRVEKIILFEGIRIHSKECRIKKASLLTSLHSLIYHMVIGIGLPMIIEYFLDPSLGDIPKRAKIFFSRVFSAIRLSFKSRRYVIYLGTDREKNAKEISRLLENT